MKYNETAAVTVNCLGVVICARCGKSLTLEDLGLDGLYYDVGVYVCPHCSNPFTLNIRQVLLSCRKKEILTFDSRLQ